MFCRKHDSILEIIFKYASTVGLRSKDATSYKMNKEIIEEDTKYGTIRIKVSSEFNTHKEKYELKDLKKIAEKIIFRLMNY